MQKKLASSGLKIKAEALLSIISIDPYQTPPPFEKLVGDLTGAISRRINIQHRIVYQVIEGEHTVKVLRMWTTTSELLSQVNGILEFTVILAGVVLPEGY